MKEVPPGRRGAGWRVNVMAALVLVAIAGACTGGGSPARSGPASTGSSGDAGGASTLRLTTGWRVASSKDADAPAEVSAPGYDDGAWIPATVPSTVLAALVADGDASDPYVGTNVERISEAPFATPWWYRTEFALDDQPGAQTWLHLDGVNYRADVWINGRLVAGKDEVVGTFRRFDLDITDAVRPGTNALAIEVQPVEPHHDLTITWIDWNPMAPDHGMGLWQPVSISRTGPVSVSDPQVVSDLPLPNTSSADLTVRATVHNASDSTVHAAVTVAAGDVRFDVPVDLAAGETRTLVFTPEDHPVLHLADPPVWWPYRMGAQPLERLAVSASVDGEVSDRAETTFGIREISSELDVRHHRQFSVNGRPLVILGGGWASDMLLRPVPGRVDAQLAYVRDLGLNTVRLEGKLETEHFYDEADRLGILVLPGWMCCDKWQKNAKWDQEDLAVAAGSMTDQALRLRNHPSVIGFMIGSDTRPPLPIAQMYADALRGADWPLPVLASASQDGSPAVGGATGVKMTGPYAWVPPGYWYDRRGQGAAFGFNTETSAGASIPEMESLRRFMTSRELHALWTEPRTPQSHAGTGASVFNNFRIFYRAMSARMGPPTSLADYVRKAQVLQYENERAMFEAFSANRPRSTGLIQWMLDNAWPSLLWNLFDWYLEPNGSYFGAKKANEPVHILYRYDDGRVTVVNDTPADLQGVTATAAVFGPDGTEQDLATSTFDVAAGAVVTRLKAPTDFPASSDPYFLELTLRDAGGKVLSTNTYWLARTMDRSAFDRSRWFVTPTSHYADLRALQDLPTVRPGVTACVAADAGGATTVRVTVRDSDAHVAFFVRARLSIGGRDLAPISWSDNDLTLMPGEARTVTARFASRLAAGRAPELTVAGWNVPAAVSTLAACG